MDIWAKVKWGVRHITPWPVLRDDMSVISWTSAKTILSRRNVAAILKIIMQQESHE